jgi:hypothetical protein
MVKKKNGKWWMCTNFTNLNTCCLKDDFPLSRIDKVVDSAAGRETMTLLDYFLTIIQYGDERKMWRKQALSHPSAHIAINECLMA